MRMIGLLCGPKPEEVSSIGPSLQKGVCRVLDGQPGVWGVHCHFPRA